ncbi:MAG: hypothetical protein KA444_09960 [Bacteroidia bacterium]|nr:hypothetical protein [Bacteroidia bacterium]
MRQFRICFFLLTSFALFLTACSPPTYLYLTKANASKDCLVKLKPDFSSVLYNTSVDVAGTHLSGLLLFKKMPDGSIRSVFTNEMGLTIFDFEFFENEFRVLHCVKKLNRTLVLRALRKDLGLILQAGYNYQKFSVYHYESSLYFAFKDADEMTYLITDKDCSSIQRIEIANGPKVKVKANFTELKSGLPDSVYIAHQSFQFNIGLKQIDRQDAP